jgi:hypothetical protein
MVNWTLRSGDYVSAYGGRSFSQALIKTVGDRNFFVEFRSTQDGNF